MKNKCFIDFDGTIVSNKRRLYHFFLNYIPVEYRDCLSIEEFWTLKKYCVNEFLWMNEQFNLFIDVDYCRKQKQKEIENDFYLSYDDLFPFARKALMDIKGKYQICLVSRRTNELALQKQLCELDIKNIFDDIIVLPHDGTPKSRAIKNIYDVTSDDIVIGDTEDDIKCGKTLGVKTYFVLSGIRDRWIMKKYPYEKIVCVDSIENI